VTARRDGRLRIQLFFRQPQSLAAGAGSTQFAGWRRGRRSMEDFAWRMSEPGSP